MISVIIPTYNRELTIERSIRSVLNQSYRNIELIVVDDGSTDNTKQIVEKINDSRIRYIFEINSGACIARNKGISVAKGDYIAFQDSDDVWKNNKLECQIKEMKTHGCKVSFCRFTRHNGQENSIDITPHIKSGVVKYYDLIRNSTVSTQTILAKKEVFDQIQFDSSIKRLQDYDWTIRAGKKYDFVLSNESLVDVYLQSNSITNNVNYLESLKSLLSKYKGTEYVEIVPILLNKIANLETMQGYRPYRKYFSAFSISHNPEFFVKGVCSLIGIMPSLLKRNVK